METQIAAIAGVFKACASALRKMATRHMLDGRIRSLVEAADMAEAVAAKLKEESETPSRSR